MCLVGTAILLGSWLAGCSNGTTASNNLASSGASPAESESPKSKLEAQRLAEATNGLSFSADRVTVETAVRRDRAAAQAKAQAAAKVMKERNTWFVSVGAYRDAVLADPSYAPAYVGLADALLTEGKTDMAEAALRTAASLDGRNPEVRYKLGLLRQMAGDYSGATKEWKQLVQFAPDHSDAYARMAIASYYARDYRSAWEYLAEAEARKQNVPPQFKPLLKEVSPRP